ncbi:MAG: hypothetical protein GX872_03880, partial [Firmicutes bacterium]|nr:hypothetical protein [Bacillota bacterium]
MSVSQAVWNAHQKSKEECTSSPKGRRISIHPYEPEVAAERKRQATPEFKEFYSKRANGERIISHLTRHGGRQARKECLQNGMHRRRRQSPVRLEPFSYANDACD